MRYQEQCALVSFLGANARPCLRAKWHSPTDHRRPDRGRICFERATRSASVQPPVFRLCERAFLMRSAVGILFKAAEAAVAEPVEAGVRGISAAASARKRVPLPSGLVMKFSADVLQLNHSPPQASRSPPQVGLAAEGCSLLIVGARPRRISRSSGTRRWRDMLRLRVAPWAIRSSRSPESLQPPADSG